MPRKVRVEFPGAVYHLLDRGDRQEAIFRDDADREQFLAALGEVCEPGQNYKLGYDALGRCVRIGKELGSVCKS